MAKLTVDRGRIRAAQAIEVQGARGRTAAQAGRAVLAAPRKGGRDDRAGRQQVGGNLVNVSRSVTLSVMADPMAAAHHADERQGTVGGVQALGHFPEDEAGDGGQVEGAGVLQRQPGDLVQFA